MEKDTLYAYKLKKGACTLQRIRNIESAEILNLPAEEQSELHEALERGTDIISSEIQMCMFMYAYGKMHIAKMQDALEHLDKLVFESDDIAIVDYGCGQGIGTLTLIEYLKAHNLKTENIKSVTLIEPSKICLERAELHISLVLPKCRINTINKKIDDISTQELDYKESNVLHIFSNILDVEGISLKHFATITQKEHVSKAEYICVGPYFGESSKQSRYDNFGELIGIPPYYKRDYHKGEWQNDWTYSVRLYSTRNNVQSSKQIQKRNAQSLRDMILHYNTFEFIDHQRDCNNKVHTFCKIGDTIIAYPSKRAQILLREKGAKAVDELKYVECYYEKTGDWVNCIIVSKQNNKSLKQESSVNKIWTFMDFARKMGQPKRAILTNSETGEEFAALMFPTPQTLDDGTTRDYTMVAFSNELGELSAKEISARKNELCIVQLESGNYYLKGIDISNTDLPF